MKHSFRYLSIAILGITLAISCQKTVEAPARPDEAVVATTQPITQTYTCVFPGSDPDSKVSLAADGKTGWEVGDEIFVHGQLGENGVVIQLGVTPGSSVSADGQTATFTATISDPCTYSSTIFVAYPADAIKDNWDDKAWLYWSNRFKTTNTHLITGYNDTQDGGTTIHFVNLCACISFVVDGDLDSNGISDFDGYTFKGNLGETVGYSTYTVRFNNNGGDKKRFYAYVSGEGWCDNTAGAQTTINVSGWNGADGSTVNYVFIPYDNGGSKAFNGGFTIQFKDGDDIIKTVSTSETVDLSANSSTYQAKYMPLGDITPYLKDYTPPVTHTATNPAINASTYDLGAAHGTANCYLIDSSVERAANKVYKFKAYQGKSTSGVGIIKSVKVLWGTYNDNSVSVDASDLIAAVDYDKQADKDYYEICFQLPAAITAGNAVIAAYDGPYDGEGKPTGNILWTWHIWIPTTNVETVNGTRILGATVMDRNLGALVKTAASGTPDIQSTGLIYQWGRKDPFPGLGSWDSSARATVAGTATTLGGQMSMTQSIANPTVYGVKDSGDWNNPQITRWGASKTIYDPCPPGYKIASGEKGSSTLLPLWRYNDSNHACIKDAVVAAAGMVWAADEYRVTITDGDNVLVFPFAGYVSDGASEYKIGYRKERAAVYFFPTNSSSVYHLNFRYDTTYETQSTSGARGCYVRCVVE